MFQAEKEKGDKRITSSIALKLITSIDLKKVNLK